MAFGLRKKNCMKKKKLKTKIIDRLPQHPMPASQHVAHRRELILRKENTRPHLSQFLRRHLRRRCSGVSYAARPTQRDLRVCTMWEIESASLLQFFGTHGIAQCVAGNYWQSRICKWVYYKLFIRWAKILLGFFFLLRVYVNGEENMKVCDTRQSHHTSESVDESHDERWLVRLIFLTVGTKPNQTKLSPHGKGATVSPERQTIIALHGAESVLWWLSKCMQLDQC